MAGVRLHHRSLRGATFVAEMPDVPYPVPFLCSACERVHHNKAIHLRLDQMGDVVVAEESWDNMRALLEPEFEMLGTVSDPEPLVLGMGGGRREAFQVVRMEDSHG